jgi:multiphosphoryl transfer protein
MVGIVVVSHSRKLAESAVELAVQMAPATPPPIEIAAGLDEQVLGTDAARVKEAIDRLASAEGVLIIMDLGSAVLSAELAMELRGEAGECPVVLSDGPLVEGLVAAVALAAAGAPLAEVAAEASKAAHIKGTRLGFGPSSSSPEPDTAFGTQARAELVINNPHGLHARPAAQFVRLVRRFAADVRVRDISSPGPAVSGRSVSGLATLGVAAGHRVEVTATGPQAREVLDAIAALVGRNFDERVAVTFSSAPGQPAEGPVAASPGIGVGPKMSLVAAAVPMPEAMPGGGSASERERLKAAIELVRSEIAATRKRVAATAGEAEAAIFDAHLLLLDDEQLAGRAQEVIEEQATPAAEAWDSVINEVAARFSDLPDPYTRARANDVRAVGDQVMGQLSAPLTAPCAGAAGVVVADDLTPAQAANLDPARVVGVAMASGSPVSHASILARSLGIPAVVGVGDSILAVADGTTIVVDGFTGTVVIDPAPELAEHYRKEAAVRRRRAAELLEHASVPAVTTDGERVNVCANISNLDEALRALQCGADGVGLLRTEFLFLDRPTPPDEAEQAAEYLAIAQALGGRRLTIRTLDIGGDKAVPYFPLPTEANPFLGRRGLRLSLCYPEVFRAQLRAIVGTAMQFPVTVLFPMVTTVDELRSARGLLFAAAAEAGCAPGALPSGMEIGAMAEVPAFVLRARAMAPLVDFISIGTNDLTQYVLAAERGNADVASVADPLDPAVLHLIGGLTQAAAGQARVAVCGEIASDPLAAKLLVGLGVRELSMTPRAIPAVKHALRSMSARRAHDVAERALQCDSAATVRALLVDGL